MHFVIFSKHRSGKFTGFRQKVYFSGKWQCRTGTLPGSGDQHSGAWPRSDFPGPSAAPRAWAPASTRRPHRRHGCRQPRARVVHQRTAAVCRPRSFTAAARSAQPRPITDPGSARRPARIDMPAAPATGQHRQTAASRLGHRPGGLARANVPAHQPHLRRKKSSIILGSWNIANIFTAYLVPTLPMAVQRGSCRARPGRRPQRLFYKGGFL